MLFVVKHIRNDVFRELFLFHRNTM